MDKTLTAKFSGPDVQQLGRPIIVVFELHNHGTEDVQVLKRGTPLEGIIGRSLDVRCEGDVVPYDGPHVKRTAPREGEFILVPAGFSVQVPISLHDGYHIERKGRYTVGFAGALLDCVAQGSVVNLDHRGRTSLSHGERYVLEAEPFTFQVQGTDAPRHTLGALARNAEKRVAARMRARVGDPKGPAFVGGTGTQKAEVAEAHETAYVMCGESLDELGGESALYVTWFGKDDPARRKTVTNNFMDIRTTMEGETITYNLTGSGCQAGWYAYTFHGSRTVYLCEAFWTAPAKGEDSQAGTVVHELSHAIAFTEDLAYGRTSCQSLARSKPDDAINNADNYEYFAEDVAGG